MALNGATTRPSLYPQHLNSAEIEGNNTTTTSNHIKIKWKKNNKITILPNSSVAAAAAAPED